MLHGVRDHSDWGVMVSTIPMNESRGNALVLIPCCKQKRVVPVEGAAGPLPGVEPLREQLLHHVRNTGELAAREENLRGILDQSAPLTRAIDLYDGYLYKAAAPALTRIASGQDPSIHLLIVSAFYGLAKLDEGLKVYEMQMGDTLCGRMQVEQFWRQKGLPDVLYAYIKQNGISIVWSLLPNSLPHTPYQQVFEDLWTRLRRTEVKCFHVKVPGAGTMTGYKRGEWLTEILDRGPGFLQGNRPPPRQFDGIPGWTFTYRTC